MKQSRPHHRPNRCTAGMKLKPRSSHSFYPPAFKAIELPDQEVVVTEEVLSRAETSYSHVVETPEGISKRYRNIKYTSSHKSSTRVKAPARTTKVFRIATKPPSHQHITPAIVSNQTAKSTNEAFINVQSDVPQP